MSSIPRIKLRRVRAAAASCGAFIVILHAGATPAAAQADDSILARVDRVFDRWRGTDGPGCAVGVSRDGTTLLERAYGMANLETGTPIRPSSIFHVASLAKQFTAAAILLLERDGKLSLDDDIRLYVPEIPDYGTRITIRHLLMHTSGLRDELELIYLARGRFEENRITEADVMNLITKQTALNFRPGTESGYSNTEYTLLAFVVKRVSGKSLRQFAAERIFKPLGMASTHFHDEFAMVVPGRTSAYETHSGPNGPWRIATPPYDIYGASNLLTTVGDLVRWEENMAHPIVGDSLMFARMRATTYLSTGDTSEYGLGLRRGRTYRGARVFESTGSDPGYQAYVARFPDQLLDVVVLCNAGLAASPTSLAHGVADVVLARSLAPIAAPVAQSGIAMAVEKLETRTGVYLQPSTLAVSRIALKETRLVLDGRSALTPLAEDRFAVSGQAGEILFDHSEESGFTRRVPGQPALHYEWHAEEKPTLARLSRYEGEYASAELDGVVYRVAATDSELVLHRGAADPLIAHLAFGDTFTADAYTIQFRRTGDRITGFLVTDARMRRVAFASR